MKATPLKPNPLFPSSWCKYFGIVQYLVFGSVAFFGCSLVSMKSTKGAEPSRGWGICMKVLFQGLTYTGRTPICGFLWVVQRKSSAFCVQLLKRRLLQKSEGNFSDRIPGWILPWIFWWIFSGLFAWKKQEEKIHQKIHGNFQIRIWEFWGQNPHCKDPALTIAWISRIGVTKTWKRPKGTLPKGTGGKAKF